MSTSTNYSERNFSAMLFFDQSEEWSLLNFIKYLDSIESLRDSSEPHRKYGIILNGIKNDENESQKKRERAEQALSTYEDEKRSSEIQEFWQQKKLQISLKEKTIKSTERMIGHINTIQDEASDILVLGKRDNLRRLKSDLGVENGGLTKSPYEDQESDDDFMPVPQPKRKKQLSLSKKAKTTKDTLSSSHGVPKPSSPPGVAKPFLSSLESAGSSAKMTSCINEINSPEPRTPPHRIFSYDTSSGSSVCKEPGSKYDTSEDDLLMKSPVDITVDCKLIVKNMCVRSKMEQWRRSSRYVEEIHKQDLMRYNILDTTKSSATEARNLFGKHWGDIIGTIEEFLTSNPDATSLAPESASALASIDQDIEQDGRADDVKQFIKSILKNVNTAEKLRDVIRIECEKLRENGNTIWRKRVLDLMEIFWKQFSNGRNRLKENQTEGHYIIKFVSHIFTILFEDQLFLDCKWGESTLQCSADQLNQSLRDDDRRCTGNKIDAIISMVDFDLEVSTLEVSGSPSCPDHTHYVGDRNKTAKMLKIILNFIKVNYPGDFGEFRRIKVYGIQIYDHDFYIYSMCMPFAGIYYFKLEKKFSYSTIPALLFKELPKFASNLWTMRDIIISSTKSIMSYITNPISESSDDDSKIDKVKTSPRKKKNN